MENVAIQISNVKKRYRLGAIGGRTLQADLQSWWAKKRGKEDPNLPIGMRQDLIGKEFMALDGINLTIHQGETIGIIGANGAGKSTLLKLLSRITAPTSGQIDIYGRITSMLEVGTGFHGEMTGRENIYMNGAILGMSKAEIDEQMDAIIEFSEVAEFIDTPVKRYSSGMFVKLAFAVAAHLKSEIMIMDEVLAVGDMAFQNKCLDKMRNVAQLEGRTILYVSHNMNTIRRLCKRCVVLEKGRIIYDGDVEHAIAIYMDHGCQINQVNLDLTKIPHFHAGKQEDLQMTHLLLPDKISPSYEEKEDLDMVIKISHKKDYKNLIFRITLRTDTDVGIGTSWSEPFDLLGEQSQSFRFKMSMANIEKGLFYLSIGLYQKDEIGREQLLDHITRALKIEVLGSPIWYTSAYGNIRLPEITVEKVEG